MENLAEPKPNQSARIFLDCNYDDVDVKDVTEDDGDDDDYGHDNDNDVRPD